MGMETVRSRIQKVLHGERPEDRLPVIEWAMGWKLTLERWRSEGLPAELDAPGIKRYFGLDMEYQHWFGNYGPVLPREAPKRSLGWIKTEAEYRELRPYLYHNPPRFDRDLWAPRAAEQAAGEAAIWLSLNGFFWWPRELFGVEAHLCSFYDEPKTLHWINEDNVAHLLRCLDVFCEVCVPDFMTFAEDMSYNHGPMISKKLFDEFMAPYYRQVIPRIKERGITVFVDSDGDVEPLIPWLEEVGVEGILPLERMAGVDVNRIRANHPQWRMLGGFDKTVMHLGEARIRQEFERLLPAMRSGGYIAAVDHQTPPAVSIDDYRLYLRLLREYAEKACR